MDLWGLGYLALDRVPWPHGPDQKRKRPSEIPWTEIFPSINAYSDLKKMMQLCTKRILVACLPFAGNVKMPQHAPHRFSKELSKKSKMVCFNENVPGTNIST
jgi:hypothetical protein